MAERRPPGFNVDLGFYDSAEVLSIPRKLRASAVGVWTLCGAYSAAKLSDGYVPEEKLRDLGCTPAIRAALCATTPESLWVNDERVGGIWFTRWAKWQRTCAEVKAYRDADAERKRVAREAKRNGRTSGNGETSGRTNAGRPQNVRPDSRTPKSESESESESESFPVVDLGGGVASVDANHPRPNCPDHEENFEGPCRRCQKRREWDETHESQVAADELDRKRRLREIAANCPDCHGTNTIEVGDNEVRKCDHGLADHA